MSVSELIFDRLPECLQWSQLHTCRLWFLTAFIYPLSTFLFPVSLHLYSYTPSLRRGIISGQNFLFFFCDWQPRWYFPRICISCRLRSIPATNGGDSRTAIPELVCSSLWVRAANQGLWWEKDSFKLHLSQSTGGAHESATSRRFPPSWGSLQIDSDSTPCTSEASTTASPIKSLLWIPLLIINVSELRGAVIGMRLWQCICVNGVFTWVCACKYVHAVLHESVRSLYHFIHMYWGV